LHFEEYCARIGGWVLKLGTKRTNVCASPAYSAGFTFFRYNSPSFFLCVESGRTHKDIRLELAPLSARGRKYFLNSYPHFLIFSIVYINF